MCLEGIMDKLEDEVAVFNYAKAVRIDDTQPSEPTILDTLERCMQQARVLETQGRELYEMMMKTVFRVRGQQESREEKKNGAE